MSGLATPAQGPSNSVLIESLLCALWALMCLRPAVWLPRGKVTEFSVQVVDERAPLGPTPVEESGRKQDWEGGGTFMQVHW